MRLFNRLWAVNLVSPGLTPREASDLAPLIRSGSLAAPMTIVEQSVIGPSMGQENLDQGLLGVASSGRSRGTFYAVLLPHFWHGSKCCAYHEHSDDCSGDVFDNPGNTDAARYRWYRAYGWAWRLMRMCSSSREFVRS